MGTVRPRHDEKGPDAAHLPIAPVSVVQFFGEPRDDVDVEVLTKKGQFLAHWPPASERSGRLQWFGSNLLAAPPPDLPPAFLPEAHWLASLRKVDSTLYLKHKSHVERFIAYDADLSLPVPLRLRGGPDEYTLQNLSKRRLADVAVIAPADGKFRVGWLDELPPAVPDKEKEKDKNKRGGKTKTKEKQGREADALFEDAEKAKDDDKGKGKDRGDDEPPLPLPSEADADLRARIDPILNRPVTVAADRVPRRQVLDQVAGQARFRYELDDRMIAKAGIDLNQQMSLNAAGLAARDALADVLGGVGLSYRVTDAGKLFITTAARLADEANRKGEVLEGPPVKLVMSPPVDPSAPSFREMTRDALARRLAAQGLREEPIKILLAQYGDALFRPGELIVLAHLSRDAIDEAVTLDVFPPPKTLVRTATLVVHGIDPRLQDRARDLVGQLGDASPKVRDAAEARLRALGPVVVPVLEDALTSKDVEVVFRAERLLLRLNRPVP